MEAATSMPNTHHLAMTPMVEDLARSSRTERALLTAGSNEWEFYLGAETAAEAYLHPERAWAKDEDWLARETVAFRNGYLSATAQLAAALSSPTPPAHLALPRP